MNTKIWAKLIKEKQERDKNKYENIINTPEPEYKLPKRDKLEGIETILNIAHPFKNQ